MNHSSRYSIIEFAWISSSDGNEQVYTRREKERKRFYFVILVELLSPHSHTIQISANQ
jgi:hypothetical protein